MTDGKGNLNSLENETGRKGLNNSVPSETKNNLNITLCVRIDVSEAK